MSPFVSRTQRGNVVEYRLWNYDIDGSMPRPEHEEALAGAVADDLLASEAPVAIVGHASRTGTDAHNRALSMRRAETVRDVLFGQGVDTSRMTVMAYGESSRLPDAEENARERAVRIIAVMPGLVPEGEGPGEPEGGQMSMPRPSDEAMYDLIASNPGVESLFNTHLTFTYVPDLLNVLGPSGAGFSGPFTLLEVFFQGHAAKGLLEADRPTDPERFARDRARVLDGVWRDYTHLLAQRGLGFNEQYEIVDADGQVVERPFQDAPPVPAE
jgi:hypothetical protein